MAYVVYKDLVVWQKSMTLVKDIYSLTRGFPREEMYGLISQMRRAAVSIPSNIAEGSRRKGEETRQFLRFAFASGAELETQIEISKQLGFCDMKKCKVIDVLLEEIMRMLNVMISK